MEAVISFLLSIAAGVVVHYLCKWLDRLLKKLQKERQE